MSENKEKANGVLQRLRSVLRESPYQEIRNLDCEFNEGILTLNGVLTTFYMKQLAQTAVNRLEGVEQVRNNAIVKPRDV